MTTQKNKHEWAYRQAEILARCSNPVERIADTLIDLQDEVDHLRSALKAIAGMASPCGNNSGDSGILKMAKDALK